MPGKRVISLSVRCGNCAIPKLDPIVLTASYSIVTIDYLAEGGDNYTMFRDVIIKTYLSGTYSNIYRHVQYAKYIRIIV